MEVQVAKSRAALGQLAARDIGGALRKGLRRKQSLRLILAAAPSQSEMLAALRHETDIDWHRITAFHMDEYIGLPEDAPQRFADWLKHEFIDHLPSIHFEPIVPGRDPRAACEAYAALLAQGPIDFVLLGIGTNGHLAFNDPPADLEDPLAVKVVTLDRMCREQQVLDGCFPTLDDVPRQAITLTIPTLLSGHELFCCVPGRHKARQCKRPLSRRSTEVVPRQRCAITRAAPCTSIKTPVPCVTSMSETTITGREPRSGDGIAIHVEAGIITRIEPSSVHSDLFLSSGLVDLQVNGCGGFDLNEEQLKTETIFQMVDTMLSQGVTCFAPTIITAPEDKTCHALSVINEARRQPRVALCIPFIHLEGPHISPLDGYRGAHPAEAVCPPSIAKFERLQRFAGGQIGMVTLSPHFSGSAGYIAALVGQGVHVAIGHTHASPEQIHEAVDAGARLSTHLGNGIATQIHRHGNPLWAQLADDRITATFIADGHHLPSDVLKAMVRAKGAERSILVSDTVALPGMAAGEYTTPVGGRVELHSDGRLCVLGSELLAGATAPLAQCIGNLVRMTDVPLHEALDMATVNPGRFARGRGQLTPGSRADILGFRWKNEVLVEEVWLAGRPVHTGGETVVQCERK